MEYCERCRRAAPAWEDPGYTDWEALALAVHLDGQPPGGG